jgi:hypothetical protein
MAGRYHLHHPSIGIDMSILENYISIGSTDNESQFYACIPSTCSISGDQGYDDAACTVYPKAI